MRRAVAVVCGIALLLLPGSAFAADTLTVQSNADTAPVAPYCAPGATGSTFTCDTLRSAVMFADAGSAGTDPTIALGSGTYTLSLGQSLAVSVSMAISGTGSTGPSISSIEGVSSRDIEVTATNATLTLSNLEVTGGHQDNNSGSSSICQYPNGSGICASGPLTLNGVLVDANEITAPAGAPGAGGENGYGAGLYANDGLTMTNSVVSDNVATGGSGGAAVDGNPATGGGAGGGAIGGIVTSGAVVISGGQITRNTSFGGTGGASSVGANGGTGGDAAGGLVALGSNSESITGTEISANDATGGAGGGSSGSGAAGTGGIGEAGGAYFAGTIESATVQGNRAVGGTGGAPDGNGGGTGGESTGGGLLLLSGSVGHSTISGNTSTSGTPGSGSAAGGLAAGGGITDGDQTQPSTPGGPLVITATTISENKSDGVGGNAYANGAAVTAAAGATVTVLNSTVYDNTTTAATGNAYGGAIHADSSDFPPPGQTTVTLANDTLDDNSINAPNANGSTLHAGDSARFIVSDSIIAGSGPASVGACLVDSGATFADHGHNLDTSAPSTCFTAGAATGDVIGGSPLLPASPSNNGGLTQTLSLGPGSGAIGTGGACTNPTSGGTLTVDQREFPRPATCDIGAFETEPIALTGAPSITGSPSVDATLSCTTGSLTLSGDGPLSPSGQVGMPTVGYSWSQDGTTLPGQNVSTYTVTPANAGHSLACTETVTGAYSSASAGSAEVVIPGAPGSVQLLRAHLGRLVVRGPTVRVPLSCSGPSGEVCVGTVTVTEGSVKKKPAGKRSPGKTKKPSKTKHDTLVPAKAHHHRAKPAPRTVVLAAHRYSLRVGKRHALTITLDRAGRKLLNRHDALKTTLRTTGTLVEHRAVTFKYLALVLGLSTEFDFYGPRGKLTGVQTLTLSGFPAHARLALACSGGGCPFSHRAVKKVHRTMALAPQFTGAHMTPGTVLTVMITAPYHLSDVLRFTLRNDIDPGENLVCYPPGTQHPVPCPKPKH